MIHIVFQQEDKNILSKSFELDESLRGDVLHIADDFAVGPLTAIYKPEGIAARKEWWRNVLKDGDYDGLVDNGSVDDEKSTADLIEKLQSDEQEIVWIWVAPNKHDASGYYWLISQLQNFVGRVFILSLNNLPFINEKGHIFYPENLFEIEPREFLKAKKLARSVTPAEFEIDPDEWQKMCNEGSIVRTLDGGKKLNRHDEYFYDEALLKFVTPDWQKANKVISHFLHKADKTTGDAYLLWRLKYLVAENKIDAQGELKKMKDFEIKLKVGQDK